MVRTMGLGTHGRDVRNVAFYLAEPHPHNDYDVRRAQLE